MCEQVPVRKAALYRAIDAIRAHQELALAEARRLALESLVGPEELREEDRVRALNWYHRYVASGDAVKIIEDMLDEAVRSGEPLV